MSKLSKLLKRCRFYLAIAVITFALLMSLIRALTPWIAQYQADIENYFSSLLGHKVVIGHLETGWYWFQPVVKLTNLTISNGHESVMDVHQLMVGINLLSSLWHWQIEPGILYLDKVHLRIRQTADNWNIEGFSSEDSKNSLFNFSSNSQVIALILAQQKLIFKHISAEIYLNDGSLIPIQDFNFIVAQHFGRHQFKGDITILRKKPTFFRVIANLSIDPTALKQTSGEIYLQGHHFQLAQWQSFLEGYPYQPVNGLINGKLWLNLTKGKLSSLQSQLAIEQFDLLDVQRQRHFKVDTLKGNWAWKRAVSGWQLSADQLQLALHGQEWPVNEFLIQYNNKEQSGMLYVRNLLLDSLFAQDFNWPATMKPLLQAKVRGSLQDTQVQVKNNQIQSILSHFSGLGWKGSKNYPMVKNLSGVIQWQPDKGRLELDGQNTLLKLQNKPSILFNELNTAIGWKKANVGWQVALERFVVRRADLLASFTGSTTINNDTIARTGSIATGMSFIPSYHDTSSSASQDSPPATIKLKGALSAMKAQRWLKYIPGQHLKPKLERWLKQDIKRIDRLVLEVDVDGPIADFPFDKPVSSGKQGIFEINAHLSGLDLFFAPNWPLTRDIEGYINYNKRTLTTDIVYAKLQDIRVDEVNLVVNDLGLDHEVLLVHGQVRTTGAKALTYVLASPLAVKLPLLKLFAIQGMLDLDLKLEAPLYPQNDKILTQGNLIFNDNTIDVNHRLSQFEIEKVRGSLAFDQEGVSDSQLKAKLLGSPVTIEIQSLPKPKSGTQIQVRGKLKMDEMRSKLNNSFLNRFQGEFPLDALLTVNNDPGDLQHAQLSSSLEGVEINLPPPLDKAAATKKPIVLEVDFPTGKGMRGKINYGSLTVDGTKLENGNWTVLIENDLVDGKLNYQVDGNQLTGVLTRLHLPQEKGNEPFLSTIKVSDLPNIELQIQDFKYGPWDLGVVDCKATSKKSSWVIDYCKIAAPTYFVQAKGEWIQQGETNQTTTDVNLSISDLGKTLTRWKLTPVVTAKHGEIQFHGQWPGGFQDFVLAKVTGVSLIMLRHGEVTHLDKSTEDKLGLGKLLSLVNLQTIPRRLMLDFSDLSHKGYVFDTFRGNFSLAQGLLSTADSTIDGPVASASITGNLDMVLQLYDVTIKVAPHLTASLPIVATIAGGPIIGAATWVASKIINQGMQKFSAFGYRVTGPWNKPVVKQIDVFKDLDKKLLGVDLL